MKKLLITGGSGLLGSNLAQEAMLAGYEVCATYQAHAFSLDKPGRSVELDITDNNKVNALCNEIGPDCIIHTAAISHVDTCERDHALADRVNVDGTRTMACAAERVGARFIHLSTDYMFDGKKGMYTEDDPIDPLSYYARTKQAAEEIVATEVAGHVIIRTTLYGWNMQDKQSFSEWVIANLRQANSVPVFADHFYTPILVNNLARALLELADNDYQGVLHVGSANRVSRAEFARQIAHVFDLDAKLLHDVITESAGLLAERPADSSLDSSRAQELLTTPILATEEALLWLKELEDSGYVRELKSAYRNEGR